MSDKIIIDAMEVMAYVGATDGERANPQRLEISVSMDWDISRAAETDRLNLTIDYAAVHGRVIEIVHHRPRALIETVAEDIARKLLLAFQLKRVEVEVRKFILPHTRSVAVRIVREGR